MSSILAGGAKTRQTPGEFGGFTSYLFTLHYSLNFETASHCAGASWTSPCSCEFSQCEIPPSYHLLSAVWKSVCFWRKVSFCAYLLVQGGKLWALGLNFLYEGIPSIFHPSLCIFCILDGK